MLCLQTGRLDHRVRALVHATPIRAGRERSHSKQRCELYKQPTGVLGGNHRLYCWWDVLCCTFTLCPSAILRANVALSFDDLYLTCTLEFPEKMLDQIKLFSIAISPTVLFPGSLYKRFSILHSSFKLYLYFLIWNCYNSVEKYV